MDGNYHCESCNYETANLYHWNRHILTEKHKSKEIIVEQTYKCDICRFSCVKKTDLDKHLLTQKHKNSTNPYEKEVKVYKCINCNNQYANASSLCKHKKKCTLINHDRLKNIKTTNDISSLLTAENFVELMKKNNELQTLLVEQQMRHEESNEKMIEKVIDIVSTSGNTTNNTTTHTNSHNTNQFNLQFFLNDTCKNALNFSEFINSIKLNIEDLEKMAELGYVDGISRIFVNALKNTDTEHRPLHCTDVKRETVYIKERDKWDKETNEKTTLKRAIEHIANKNIENIQVWKEENPSSLIVNTQESNQLEQLYQVVVNGSEKDENRIIRNLLTEITIEK